MNSPDNYIIIMIMMMKVRRRKKNESSSSSSSNKIIEQIQKLQLTQPDAVIVLNNIVSTLK